MSRINYAIIIFSVIIIAAGQIIFKLAARSIHVAPGATWASVLYSNLQPIIILVGALGLYFLSTLAWVWALRTTPLSIAFMFNSLAFVIVPLAGFFIFDEDVPKNFFLGMAMIIGGIIVINVP